MSSVINVLQSRKIHFKGSSCDNRLNELCTYMNQLPVDTICLLPTKILKDKDDKVLETVDIERVIAITIGAKIMIRRNIERVFSGQVYVDLSRVSTLEGLHLLNFNPVSIKVNSGAIVEYNRLRFVFKVQLP
ncbi:hypothetical protein ALC53_00032 [Atta colombica]|uniref:Uncharacterized protein n=1 Tax=Atta colombica TaxID=520822 RepID=A0A151K1D7_9HYME|nr:hypothetical protein ALC53_12704 [Atta colombica]KYN45474.1 hypothetical protein ALC53_00032 [Atta colombica]